MPSDDQIQEQILGWLCDRFEEEGWERSYQIQAMIEDVQASLDDVDEDQIRYHVDRLNSQHFINHNPATGGAGTVNLLRSGLEKYEDLSNEVVLPQANVMEVLEILYEEERESPSRPSVSREELISETGLTEEELDGTVWYLRESGLAELLTGVGTTFRSAEITERGRQYYERQA